MSSVSRDAIRSERRLRHAERACYFFATFLLLFQGGLQEVGAGGEVGGVLGDVVLDGGELGGGADEVVEGFFLPEAAVGAERFVDFAGGEVFPGGALGGDFGGVLQADDEVDVVGHDDEVAEVVACAVEMAEGAGNDGGEFWAAEDASAEAFVEGFHIGLGKGLMELAAGVFGELVELVAPVGGGWGDVVEFEPGGAAGIPLAADFGGDGVFGAEGDEVGGVVLEPVREVCAVGDLDGELGVEEFEHGT